MSTFVKNQMTVALLFTALVGVGLWWLFGHSEDWRWQVLAWLIAVNLLTLVYFFLDKHLANRGSRRVPEMVLLGLCAVGGSPAGLIAMPLLRHKTSKVSFRIAFWLIVVVQTLAVGWVLWTNWRG